MMIATAFGFVMTRGVGLRPRDDADFAVIARRRSPRGNPEGVLFDVFGFRFA